MGKMLSAGFAVSIALLTPASILAQRAPPPEPPAAGVQVVPLTAETLHQGWRATDVLGEQVGSRDGDLGAVRNILIGRDGGIEALIVEGAGSATISEFVYRVPWAKVEKSELPGRVSAAVPGDSVRRLGLFPKEDATILPNEFPVTEVIGDYARLQAGRAYGYVSDVVFSADGRRLAVLVTRDATVGGGTHAFGFPGETGRWNPAAGYYGLPYVTAQQASAAAVRVDPKRFSDRPKETGGRGD
jgi:hypothetical protein